MVNSASAMSNEALIEILNQSCQATAIFSGRGLQIQMANKAMLELWGKDETVLGKTYYDAIPELQDHPATKLLQEAMDNNEIRQGNNIPTSKMSDKGITSYYDYVIQPVKNSNGILCILQTAVEVTGRVKSLELIQQKQKSEQLISDQLQAKGEGYRLSNQDPGNTDKILTETYNKLFFTEHRMQELIRTTPIGLTILQGENMVIETANPAMLEIWGSNGNSVIGKPLLEVFPLIADQTFSEQLDQVYRSGKTISLKEIIDTSHQLIEGEGKYLDIDFHPLLNPYGKVDAIMATVQDVTVRVTSRMALQANELRLQEYTEELAVMNEEMQTTNEELATLNEEYNSTNEQMDFFNQSVRDLNQQLKDKNKNPSLSNVGFQKTTDTLHQSNLELSALNSSFEILNTRIVDSERSLRNLIAQAPIAIMLVKGDDFIVTMINPKMLELIGCGEEIIGKSLFKQIPELNGQYAANQLISTYQDGNPRGELSSPVMLMRNGEPYHGFFNFNYSPLIEQGKVTGVIDMALEVTPQVIAIKEKEEIIAEKSVLEETLRKSEQRLQGILETMAEGVGIIDATGKLVYANPMAQQILGLTLSEIEDRTYDDPRWQNLRLDGSDLPQQEHPMSIMMSSRKPVFDQEIGVQPPDRQRFYISINAAPIFDEKGNLTGGIGTFMDVTTRRMIAQGKDDFISIASHELKTPVTSLKASLQLLERAHNRLPEESREKLIKQSIRSLENLSKLINDLLDTSRIDKGHLIVEKRTFPLKELLFQSCNQAVQGSSQQIIFQGECDQIVEADDQQIGQVLVNFITNAIKYAPGSRDIIVRSSMPAPTEIKVSVIDSGPGIPKEQLKHLFERYYRTDYKGQKFTGLGLGLYISAEIIKNHGGTIGANSEQGKGSEFWFTLPLIQIG